MMCGHDHVTYFLPHCFELTLEGLEELVSKLLYKGEGLNVLFCHDLRGHPGLVLEAQEALRGHPDLVLEAQEELPQSPQNLARVSAGSGGSDSSIFCGHPHRGARDIWPMPSSYDCPRRSRTRTRPRRSLPQ